MADNKSKKKGLGRGLDALFTDPVFTEPEVIPSAETETPAEDIGEIIRFIPLADIEPNLHQPRKAFDGDALTALASSIAEHGVLSPLLVTPTANGTFEIVAGERRWRASKIAGLSEVPCIVRELEQQNIMEIALVENLQREDLNPIEEAEGYRELMKAFSLTQEEVAKRVGKNRSTVANALRLNNLCDSVKTMLREEKLTQGHARALLTLDAKKQEELAQKIIDNDLNVRQAEALARSAGEDKKSVAPKKVVNPMTQKYYNDLEASLASRFGTKVKISESNKKGKIEIEYYSKDDLERILFELRR